MFLTRASQFFTNTSQESDESVVINGVPDWIYEEDVLKADRAIWGRKKEGGREGRMR